MKTILSWCLLALTFVVVGTSAQAQTMPAATIEDYGKWHSLSQITLSDDGKWIAYSLTMQENNDTLWVENQASGKRTPYEFAGQAAFSPDNKWLGMRIGVSYAEQEKLTEAKKPVEYSLGLVNLATGELEKVKGITSFRFSDDGKWMTINMAKPADSKAPGTTVLLRELATGKTRSIGNVVESSFNAKKSNRLAYATTSGTVHTVELIDLGTSATWVLASDTTKFSQLSWDKEGQALAFFSEWKDSGYEEETQKLHYYPAMATNPQMKTLEGKGKLPEDMRMFGSSNVRISDDLTRVHFGMKDWTPKPAPDTSKAKKPAKKEKLAGVDVWNWDDKEVQPRQKVMYNQDKNRSLEAVWFVNTGKVVALADEKAPYSSSDLSHNTVVAWDSDKYKPAFKDDMADYYLVDINTGNKTMLLEGQPMGFGKTPSPSSTGRYLTYFKERQFYVFDTKSGTHTNVSESLPYPVYNLRDDRPGIVGPFGMAGWLKGDTAFLIYDEYDVWKIQPDGKNPQKLTNGRDEEIIYRVTRLDFEDPFIDPAKNIMLTMTGDNDRKTGYAQLDPKGKLSTLVYESMGVGRLSKAKNADAYTYVTQAFDTPPILTSAGADLKSPKTVFKSNPQAYNYARSKSELVYFTSKDGRPLKGALHYPVNYEEGKQYPMIVYIYEIVSNQIHNYANPSVRSAYNLNHYTNQGYFVFKPDIVYEIDDPGMSAVNCVVPAVEKVLETGMVRRDGIAIMGHSWGGYQTAFLVTQTDLFSAAIAGAPLTNMMSMSLAIYWNSGTPNQKIFETSQGRFSGPWYETQDAHFRNSPIIHADKIDTPMLMTFGDKDGAVDWHQGIEMYGTMRRMGKPFTLLVYADENHGLAKRENQMDYFNKVTSFLDHHLKGNEAPEWLSKGVPYIQKMEAQEANK